MWRSVRNAALTVMDEGIAALDTETCLRCTLAHAQTQLVNAHPTGAGARQGRAGAVVAVAASIRSASNSWMS